MMHLARLAGMVVLALDIQCERDEATAEALKSTAIELGATVSKLVQSVTDSLACTVVLLGVQLRVGKQWKLVELRKVKGGSRLW